MLPAYAGMIPDGAGLDCDTGRAPRVCGDDPALARVLTVFECVLPAYAGMILVGLMYCGWFVCAPRACGHHPEDREKGNSDDRCSPRMRG